MQIEIRLEPGCREPRVIVVAEKMDRQVQQILEKLSRERKELIAAFRDEQVELLEPGAIYRIYAQGGKVLAQTKDGVYTLRARLYEMEEQLEGRPFVRISNSDIINLKKVKGFDLSFTGTIQVTLTNGTVTYVSRRYVGKIKEILGL